MFSKLVLLASAVTVSAECAGWCNPYTCDAGDGITKCDTCAVCTSVTDGSYCASWCNQYTCSSDMCEGCTAAHGNADHCGYLTGSGKRCLNWCNDFTCGSHDTDCGACDGTGGMPNCADTSTFCQSWCNEWTTGSMYCVGCGVSDDDTVGDGDVGGDR